MARMDQIFGFLERITFQNPENGYTVAKLEEPRRPELTCIVGMMPTVKAGETVRCQGEWKNHLIHGRQFEVESYTTETPADANGIEKYLASGLIKGIGPTYAKRIVAIYGENTLNIIDTNPESLLEISGIGKKRVSTISRCWEEQKSIRELMIFLQSVGVSPAFAQKVFRRYGESSINQLKDNPYKLANDIKGVGFKTADNVAKKMGIPDDSPQRIESGVTYVLSELASDGNVCYPVDDFLLAAETMLNVERALVQERLDFLNKSGRIALDKLVDKEVSDEPIPFIWSKPLFLCEKGIAREIGRLASSDCSLRAIDCEKAIEWVQKTLHIQLAKNQETAVSLALQTKLQIITGGPGTGKSTITKAILAVTEKLSKNIVLAAPTGRAAKRMSEITHKKASTLHSLLEYDFSTGGFKRNRKSPIEADLIIVDEASMIDTHLMYSLLKAVPSHARLILVGDINQLPSVGPGNVLRDMIDSEALSVTMLTEIFRQAKGSQIITNAHRINQGEFPFLKNRANSDFFFIEEGEPLDILESIVGLVTTRLPKKYNFHSFEDIQVLAPMKRGPIGTQNINLVLQERMKLSGEPLQRGGYKYFVGDKMMQIRNNYKRGVYNGDVGRISKISHSDQELTVSIDGKEIVYDFNDLDELNHAYAVSIHKYQGSECPCIIIPVHTAHFKLLHRNLLYTGVTRGKQLVVLVGTKKAIAIAVHNDEVKRRYTGLQQAIQD
jgi:exodeoxyribonuclease V alpha subunit